MKEINLNSWKDFKEICINKKKLNIQYFIKDGIYNIFGIDGPIIWNISLPIDSEKSKEFKTQFKAGANKKL